MSPILEGLERPELDAGIRFDAECVLYCSNWKADCAASCRYPLYEVIVVSAHSGQNGIIPPPIDPSWLLSSSISVLPS